MIFPFEVYGILFECPYKERESDCLFKCIDEKPYFEKMKVA